MDALNHCSADGLIACPVVAGFEFQNFTKSMIEKKQQNFICNKDLEPGKAAWKKSCCIFMTRFHGHPRPRWQRLQKIVNGGWLETQFLERHRCNQC
jgi:hypothetical protein